MAKENGRRIKHKNCSYLESDVLPLLILATRENYKFTDTRTWMLIAHQTAGNGCHQNYLMGTVLKPRTSVLPTLQEIVGGWYGSNYGFTERPLSGVLRYRAQLRKIDVDCERSYPDFEEGMYPIDCTRDNLQRMTTERLPVNLDKLVNWKNGLEFSEATLIRKLVAQRPACSLATLQAAGRPPRLTGSIVTVGTASIIATRAWSPAPLYPLR
jgi:hypothetical protein